jgi:hypothetical protein
MFVYFILLQQLKNYNDSTCHRRESANLYASFIVKSLPMLQISALHRSHPFVQTTFLYGQDTDRRNMPARVRQYK